MSFLNYIQFLEPVQENVSRLYTTTTGLIALILIIWLVNLIFGMVQRTFAAGKIIGRFYRNYIHKYMKIGFFKLFSLNNKLNKNRTSSLPKSVDL